MIRGHLRVIVLKNLADNDMSGYSLMKKIYAETGCKPSTGSMYPLLDNFLDSGFATVKKSGRKKVYSITEKGKENLKPLLEKKDEIIDQIAEGWKVFEAISGKDDKGFIAELIESMKKGELPFKEINPEITEFRTLLYKTLKTGKISENRKEIKSILNNAIKKLKNLK